jgi:hypothetical protein
MSDSTPQAPQGQFQAFPGEMPSGSPTQEPEGAYQSLSLLALLGFCLAVLAAAEVLVGGLVPMYRNWAPWFYATLVLAPLIAVGFGGALRGERSTERVASHAGVGLLVWAVALGLIGLIISASSEAWALGLWFWVPVGASLVLCLLGWAFIANSEGTVTGEWYARWGIFLSLFFGMIYVAYLFAISLATAAQARAAANEFVAKLKEGNEAEAYMLTTRPSARGSNPRTQAEAENAQGGPQAGPYTLFCTSDFARLFGVSGGEATLTETHYEVLPPRGNQVAVRLGYRVRTRYHEFDMALTLASEEVTVDRVRQRRWFVVFRPPTARTPEDAVSPQVTDIETDEAWRSYELAGRAAFEELGPFLQQLSVKPKPRPDIEQDFKGTWAVSDDQKQSVKRELDALLAGSPKKPIAVLPLRDGMQQVVKPAFEVSDDGKRVTVMFDLQAGIGRLGNRPEYLAEGRAFVEGPFDGAKGKFKLKKLKWDRVRKIEGPAPPPG